MNPGRPPHNSITIAWNRGVQRPGSWGDYRGEE